LPQKPQFVGSLARAAQLAPHFSKPAAHMLEHAPCEQTCSAAHAMPHPPQLAGSEAKLTQLGPHALRPDVQMHEPETQL
jgi:hypothetical protein